MANPDGPGRKTMQCHSLLRHDQAHRSPDGFRSHGYSGSRLWATSIVKTGRGPEKGVNGKAAIIARKRNTHIRHKAIMQKSAQSALRGCRLGTAIGALQGPFDVMITSRSPAFRWSISSVCGIHTHGPTHAHMCTQDGCDALLRQTAPRMAKGDVWSVAKAGESKSPRQQWRLRCTLPSSLEPDG